MVCDDSALIRGVLTRALQSDPDIQVVAGVSDGQMAVSSLIQNRVEVCILDIEMPIMDGLTALPKLIDLQPDLQVIVASTLTRRNAEISLRALSAGAADYLTKPSSTVQDGTDFKIEIVAKVKALGAARRRIARIPQPHGSAPYVGTPNQYTLPPGAPASIYTPSAPRPVTPSPVSHTAVSHTPVSHTPVSPAPVSLAPTPSHAPASLRAPLPQQPAARAPLPVSTPAPAPGPAPAAPARPAFTRPATRAPISLRPAPTDIPDIIAIGSSTGGPQALFKVLSGIGPGTAQPIVITQHMPATFTTILAEHIHRATGIPTVEASEGLKIEGGRAYVAPGDFHMTIESQGGSRVVHLLKTPQENYCRPSVDPMLRSLVKIFGKRLMVIILTGMGQDGLRGSEAVVAAGGSVVAQDEASSVVWGMPGAVAMAGICSAVLPVGDIASYVRRHIGRAA